MPNSLEYQRAYRLEKQTELQALTRNLACVCCGKVPAQLDHITPAVFHYKFGYKTRDRLAAPARLHDYKAGVFQPLCSTCNLSKGTGTTCAVHSKYLGLWQYLPALDDLEAAG